MPATEHTTSVRAVFWDFGGVILSSPFEAFNEYERSRGLPIDFIRSVNTRNPDTNAWARIERQEVDAGHIRRAVRRRIRRTGPSHPRRRRLVDVERRGPTRDGGHVGPVIDAGYTTACLTNNVRDPDPAPPAPTSMR